MTDYTGLTVTAPISSIGIRRVSYWKPFPAITDNVTGSLSGTLKISNVAQANRLIRLYYRPNGKVVSQTYSASDGTFSFSGLDPTDTGNYFAIAFLDDAGYNALVFDKLTAG
jgi:hypothetical protein